MENGDWGERGGGTGVICHSLPPFDEQAGIGRYDDVLCVRYFGQIKGPLVTLYESLIP